GQCRRGLGDERPDRRAARLRDERQGDQRRRPDAAIHHRTVPLRRLTMMLRSTLFATALLAAIVPGLARAGDEAIAMPTLRANVTVNGDIVRIGDVIDNAGTAAQIAIYRAPDLGTTGTLPAAQVIAALSTHQVIGVQTKGIKEITVTRAARTIEAKDIQQA